MPDRVKEKLVELIDDIQARGEDFTDYEIYGMRLPNTVSNEDVASHLIAHGVTVQENCKACAEATQNCILKLQGQIAELCSAQEWISVKDRLPDRDGWYITQTNATGRSNGTLPQEFEIRNGVGRWRYRDRLSPWNTTHWQPMPQPPKGE